MICLPVLLKYSQYRPTDYNGSSCVKVDKKHGPINVPQNNEPIRHYFN